MARTEAEQKESNRSNNYISFYSFDLGTKDFPADQQLKINSAGVCIKRMLVE